MTRRKAVFVTFWKKFQSNYFFTENAFVNFNLKKVNHCCLLSLLKNKKVIYSDMLFRQSADISVTRQTESMENLGY